MANAVSSGAGRVATARPRLEPIHIIKLFYGFSRDAPTAYYTVL